MKTIQVTVISTLLLASSFMSAKVINSDFSIEKIGTTYRIEEPNAIVEIQEKLAQKQKTGELEKLQIEYQKRISQNALDLPPVEGLKTVEKSSVREFEPTFTLPETMYDQDNNIIAAAGSVIRPLEVSPMPFKLFFFDGREEEQVALAKKMSKKYGEEFMPILTAGRWDKLSVEMNQAVYFDQAGRMSERFKLTEVPSLIYQVENRLRIESVKP